MLLAASLPLFASAQMTTPSAGLVPGNFWYFLDRFTEKVEFFYTFNGESRAKLALEHAQERIAELNEVLFVDGIDSAHAMKAREGFDQEIVKASGIVKEKKSAHAELASRIDQDIETSRESLKAVYHNYHEALKKEGDELRSKIDNGNSDDALENRLAHIDDEILGLMDAEDALHNAFEQEKEHLAQVMGGEQSAKSHIANALRARARFVEEMKLSGMATSTLVSEALSSFDATLKKAENSLSLKDFESASDYAKDAQWELNDTRNEVDTDEIEKIFFEDKGSSEMEFEGEDRGEERGGRSEDR